MGNHKPSLKTALSIDEQIKLLESRDLIISDRIYAKEVLERISYYRLSGYLLPFKTKQSTYKIGTHFEQIVNLYEFDAELRNHLFRLCEYIEVQTRALLSHFIAMKHPLDPLCYKNPNHFNPRKRSQFDKVLEEWEIELNRKKVPKFIEHYRSHYNGEVPIWVAIEIVNLTLLSKFYSVFKEDHQKEISRTFKLKKVYLLESWLRSVTELRNKCAHGSRLYGASLSSPALLSQDAKSLNLNPLKVFSIIFAAKYLVRDRNFWTEWVNDLEKKLSKFEQDIELKHIGFVLNWKRHLLSSPTDTW